MVARLLQEKHRSRRRSLRHPRRGPRPAQEPHRPGTRTVAKPRSKHRSRRTGAGRRRPRCAPARHLHRHHTRGHGGYVVGAGSITPHGRYLATSTTAPQPLPTWITDALDASTPYPGPAGTVPELKNTSAYSLAALAGELEEVLAATTGQRNDTLNRAAFALGQLVGAHLLDEAIARDELLSAAGRIGLPLTEAE